MNFPCLPEFSAPEDQGLSVIGRLEEAYGPGIADKKRPAFEQAFFRQLKC
jgi:hypothetical protein